MNAQYAILRFAKYKGPEIGHIEAHNERTKENYASNPDIISEKRKDNFHLITPSCGYRAGAERQIAAAGCRTRKDSVRLVETLVTASPEFFQGKKPTEVRAFFQEALDFLTAHQSKETMLSAVVHMDETTPHMHLTFVPLTTDGRLSAKEILGNKKKLTGWQDQFWSHMVKKFPDLERGESASITGRSHIPPRVFKEAVHLNRQKAMLTDLLEGITPFNAKKRGVEIQAILDSYLPNVAKMKTQVKKYQGVYHQLQEENKLLSQKVEDSKESVLARLKNMERMKELEELEKAVEGIPEEVLLAYTKQTQSMGKEDDILERR